MIRNWAGNQEFTPRRVAFPASVDEVRDLVAATDTVGVLGAGHSFTDVVNDRGTLVRLDRMPRRIVVDERRGSAVVSAGTTYTELAGVLHPKGWAVANLPSLPHITLGGAVATGTHGSGVRLRSLADSVRAVRYVVAGGGLRTFSAADDPEHFPGTVVALGALGVAVDYTIALTPTFDVAQSVRTGFTVDEVVRDLPAILSCAYSVSVFTDWSDQTNVFLKERLDGPATTWPGGTRADRMIPHVPDGPTDGMTPQLAQPGPWFERLPHVLADADLRAGTELQSEYLVPAEDAPAAARAVRDRVAAISACLQVSELRAIRADEHWLSPAYDRDSVSLHFTWRWDPSAVRRAIEVVEEALRPFSPRPHWGKLHGMSAATLAGRYPRLDRFRALVAEVDPAGTFRSPLVERLLARAGATASMSD
ncbi:FAD-binding protein [Micromonospora sp. NPDC049645]|uniref:FAD-binding protein n=1 Tax=Micromonospora sp. NPDC049645 TaxID=3155508 RepID=UPI00344814E3